MLVIILVYVNRTFFLPPAIADINRGPEGVRYNGSWLYFLLSYTGNILRGMSIHIIFIWWRDSNVPDVYHVINCIASR